MKNRIRFELVIDKKMNDELNRLASLSRTGLTKTHLIREAVAEYLIRKSGQRENLR